MMDRRTFVVGTAALLAAPLAAEAQTAGRVYRIGYLAQLEPSATWRANPQNQTLLRALGELGYVEGRNLVIDFRSAEGQSERLPALAAELVSLKPDVLITGITITTRALKQATSTIPIVMALVSDPVGSGFVQSLAKPGGKITGLTTLAPELSGKRLQLLKECIAHLSRVGVLRNPDPLGPGAIHWRNTQLAGAAAGVTLQSIEATRPDQLPSVFATMTHQQLEALLVLPDSLFFYQRSQIVALAAAHRIPAMYEFRDFVDAGGLMAYGTNLYDLWRRAAGYIDRILKGANPADLPIQQPTKFDFVINLKTAKALGLTIPPAVLARADEVIQ